MGHFCLVLCRCTHINLPAVAVSMGLVGFLKLVFYHAVYLRFLRIKLMFSSKHRTDLDLSGKTVLITGAANGIGRALALDLLKLPKRPAKLLLWDLLKFDDFQDGENRNGTIIHTRNVDVTDYKTVERLITEDGPIHVCVCNAGIGAGLKFEQMPFDKFTKTIDVNFLAKVRMTKIVLDKYSDYIEHFVYTSSAASFVGSGRMTEYCASKAAIRSFAEGLGAELQKRPKPVDVTIICPYFAQSKLTETIKDPMKKYTWTTVETISDSILKGLMYPELHTIPVGFMGYVLLGFLNICGTAFVSRGAMKTRKMTLTKHSQ